MAVLAFIGGISAVGKTSLLASLPGRDRTWLRWSAGQLIADELGVTTLPTDQADDVLRYQEALVRAYQRRCRDVSLPIVMDGHFALPTKSSWMAVPIDIFRALAPRALVLLEAAPEAIRRRRARRDGAAPTTAEIAAGTLAERTAAREVAATLGLTLYEWPAEPRAAASFATLIEGLDA
jgi:adenylate kinase